MNALFRRATAALGALVLFGCQGVNEPIEPPGEIAASDKTRLAVAAPPADLAAAVKGHNNLTFDLLRASAPTGANFFYSPLSISTALSMTYAGAANGTATAFEGVLGSGLAAGAHHRAMNDLDAQLASRGQNAQGADGAPFRLNSTNQLFAAQGYPFETPFLDTLAQEYGAHVRLMDFEAQTEPSRVAINDWVSQRTEQRIKDLLAPGILNADTRLVLVNAIYFNAAWDVPFEEALTANGSFYKEDESTLSVPLMRNTDLSTRAATVNGTEVFELPYDGNELSMLVLMPPLGALAQLEASLSASKVESYLAALKGEHLDLRFPRFEVRSSANLSEPLKQLGLGVAFTPDADFSAMTKAETLAITDVVHQAFVKVNEKGTEAAAATAVVVGPTSLPSMRELTVDRPFLFLIRDNATGAVVFAGRIVKP